MANEIHVRQNDPYSLELLASQRHLYSRAKLLRVAELLITFGLVPLGSAIATAVRWLWPDGVAPDYIVGLSGMAGLASVFILGTLVKGKMGTAAKMQEMFDCHVLSLTWNRHLAASEIAPELVKRHSGAFVKAGGSIDSLRDWYAGEFHDIPLSPARLICQRQSATWDQDLRSAYAAVLVWACAVVIVLLLAFGILRGLTVLSFLVGVLFLAGPVLVFTIREIKDNRDWMRGLRDSESLANQAWQQAKTVGVETSELSEESRRIQDRIYLHRRSAALVLDKLYWHRRSRQEAESKYSVKRMVEEYKRAVQAP